MADKAIEMPSSVKKAGFNGGKMGSNGGEKDSKHGWKDSNSGGEDSKYGREDSKRDGKGSNNGGEGSNNTRKLFNYFSARFKLAPLRSSVFRLLSPASCLLSFVCRPPIFCLHFSSLNSILLYIDGHLAVK